MSAQLCITVNLGAIVANWRLLQSRTTGTEVGAVVKANAYGLGMLEVASALAEAGCRRFFVANVQEGTSLRKRLGSDPLIYVLQGAPAGSEPAFLERRLTPVLISLAMAERWLAFSQAHKAQACFDCALKVNTGMHRLGLDIAEVHQLSRTYPEFWRQSAPLLMSHLACADDPVHPLNREQLQAFRALLGAIKEYNPRAQASLCNSSGIFLGADYHFDIARPGSALYGINPTPGCANPMLATVALALPILQLRQVPAGGRVGYGAEAVASQDMTLAIVAGGYADGILRAGYPGLKGAWRGQKVAAIGRVSMDMLAFDVTGLEVTEGDGIEILGDHLSVDEQAGAAATIGYELLTRLGDRVHRQYSQGGA